MNYEEKIEQLITAELEKGRLFDIAAVAIRHGLSQGYCEFTEHAELWKLLAKFHCPFCGRQHRSKFHDELNRFYSDDKLYDNAVNEYDKEHAGNLIYPGTSSLIPYFPGFDKTLTEENPQEYLPD